MHFYPHETILSNFNIQADKALRREAAGAGIIIDHSVDYDDHFLTAHEQDAGARAVFAANVPDPDVFSRGVEHPYIKANVNGFPIKYAGSDEYKIPNELNNLEQTIKTMMEDQFARCPLAIYKNAIMFYSSHTVRKGDVQRTNRWHRDLPDVASAMFNRTYPVSVNIPAQIYVVSDCAPTQVQNKALTRQFNMFSPPENKDLPVREGMVRQLAPYEIGLLNSTVWHRGVPMTQSRPRNFLAVMFLATKPMENMLRQGVLTKKGFQP